MLQSGPGSVSIPVLTVWYGPPHIIRAGEPGLEKEPHVQPGEGVDGTDLMGALPVFVANALREAGVPWEHVPLSDEAKAWSPSSSYTACLHDLATGKADIGLANFLTTPARWRLMPFTQTLYSDQYYLVVRREKQQVGFLEAILRPFEPFTPRLWVVIALVFAWVGISLSYEGGSESGDHEGLWEFVLEGGVPIAVLKGLNAFVHGEVRRHPSSWHVASAGDISQRGAVPAAPPCPL